MGLAGPSGAGKTAFARKIQALIPNTALLSMDNYNDGSKVIDGNFDDPRITDYDTLLSNLSDLKSGKAAEVPIYDFKTSSRIGYKTVNVPSSRVIILEGIYALSHRLRPLLDLRVSITGGVHFDLVKRVLRDIDRSGQAPEEIIQQVSDTVHPMYKAFIEPDLKAAHLRIHNPFNPFSGFMHPTYILKSGKPTSEADILKVLGKGAARKTESEIYDIYLVPPGEDPETCQSWLRMRYRDGRYNLMFEEWVVEGDFIISPRVTFEVPVRILGGLMALGYEIGTIMQRNAESYTSDLLSIPICQEEVASNISSPYLKALKNEDNNDFSFQTSEASTNANGTGSTTMSPSDSCREVYANIPVTKLKSPVTVKLDHILGMDRCFIQVQGKDRIAVAAVASALNLKGSFIRHSYIEVVQLENLTQSFQTVTEDLKRRFAVNGEPLIDENVVGSFSRGSSPLFNSSFTRSLAYGLTSPSKSSVPSRGLSSTKKDDSFLKDSVSERSSVDAGIPPVSNSAPSHSTPIPVRRTAAACSSVEKGQGLLSQKMKAFGSNNSGASMNHAVENVNGDFMNSMHNGNKTALADHTNINNFIYAENRKGYSSRRGSSASSGSGSISNPEDMQARRHTRSSSPLGVDRQLKKLVQTQALLTSQMEELSVQLRVLSSSLPPDGLPNIHSFAVGSGGSPTDTVQNNAENNDETNKGPGRSGSMLGYRIPFGYKEDFKFLSIGILAGAVGMYLLSSWRYRN